jgi:uncharacterized membrane protein
MRWIAGWLAALVIFVAGDMIWLRLTEPRLYRPVIGPLLAERPDLKAALAFYALYLTGITAFAIAPSLRSGRPQDALGWGALFGLVAYGTYDLTNQATLRLWSTRLSLIDMAWGAAITGLAALIGSIVARAVNKG